MSQTLQLHKVYYINLDTSVARKAHLEAQLHAAKLDKLSVRFNAIEGRSHQFSAAEEQLFAPADFLTLGAKVVQSLKGSFLSHLALWEIAATLAPQQCLLILEDDALICGDFAARLNEVLEHTPDDAEIIWLGSHRYIGCDYFIPIDFNAQTLITEQSVHFSDHPHATDFVGHLKKEVNPTTLAYLITAAGAKNLIKHSRLTGVLRATDWQMNDFFYSRSRQYAAYYPLATSSSELFKSDIWRP